MPRVPRRALAGFAYHVLNRAVRRQAIFATSTDYAAFESLLVEALQRTPVRLLAYCLMPNHWHLVVWPSSTAQLSQLMQWLTLTHTSRWHVAHGTRGTGPLYQGRFKSVPVQEDEHLLRVCRYVERNPLRASLVDRAEQWRWSSLWHRRRGSSHVPLERLQNFLAPEWIDFVNGPQTLAELGAIRCAIRHGTPVGRREWVDATALLAGLPPLPRSVGRPRRK
jgi:putative transposase